MAKQVCLPGSGFSEKDGVYYSKWEPVQFPDDVYLDLATYVFSGKYGDALALVDPVDGTHVTFRELERRVYALASGLAANGVTRGEVVMILAPNSVLVPMLMFAVIKLGAVVTAVNPVNTASEIAEQVEGSGAKYFITVAELVPKIAPLNLPIVLMDVENETLPGSCLSAIVRCTDLLKADPTKAPKIRIKQTDTALILYSSGTVGKSKGVVLSHGNLISALEITTSPGVGLTPPTVSLSIIPLFHVMGIIFTLFAHLKTGGTVVIMPKFDLLVMLKAIERYRVTALAIVPPVLYALATLPLVLKFDCCSVTTIITGAAVAEEDILHACRARFVNAEIGQGFGLTESTGVCAGCPRLNVPSTSCGLLLPSMEAKILDVESRKPLPPFQKGELLLRGRCIMQGYLNNPQATAESIDHEGWLLTGDLCYFDDNGWLYFVDRIKELIKYNGYQVMPGELEALLKSHPRISDAAVVPFHDKQRGQLPMAFIVRSEKSSLSEVAVMDFVAAQVAPYKKIRKVAFLSAIPKSLAGKVLKKELLALQTAKL